MDLPQQIKSQLEKLAKKQQFLQNIDEFVKVCFNLIHSSQTQINYEDQQMCPTALLLAISHYICVGKPVPSISAILPQQYQQKFEKACQKYAPEQSLRKQQIRELIDVKWEIVIVLGRQLWQIRLIFSDKSQLKFVLNYEQLSVFVFKLGQIVSFIPTVKI